MPTGRPGRTVSAATNVRFQPETLEVVQLLAERSGGSASGSVRAIVNLWLSQFGTGPLSENGVQRQELDVDAAAAALTEWLELERQDAAETAAAESRDQ